MAGRSDLAAEAIIAAVLASNLELKTAPRTCCPSLRVVPPVAEQHGSIRTRQSRAIAGHHLGFLRCSHPRVKDRERTCSGCPRTALLTGSIRVILFASKWMSTAIRGRIELKWSGGGVQLVGARSSPVITFATTLAAISVLASATTPFNLLQFGAGQFSRPGRLSTRPQRRGRQEP